MTPQRILAINVSRIGDTLLATPALRAIAARWPQAKIDCLGHPNRVEVLEHLPFLARVDAITKKSAPFKGWASKLRGARYDLAFVWGYDASLVAYALREARRTVAFRQADERLNARLFKVVEPPAFQSDHAVRLAFALPAALDVPPAGWRLSYAVTPAEAAWAQQRLSELPAAAPRIGLQVASFPTKAYRDWPVEHFMTLCDRIRARWPLAHFLIFGGSEERERTAALQAHLGAAATLFAGRLSLRETGALMSLLDLYVGVDTGPTHLMSTFDIPLVALYHGTSGANLIGPLDHPCLYTIDHPLAGPTCALDTSMADISVDSVFARVEQAFAEHPPNASRSDTTGSIK